jgi:hypothetical protein
MLQRVKQYSGKLFCPAADALVLALLGRTTFAYGDLIAGTTTPRAHDAGMVRWAASQ